MSLHGVRDALREAKRAIALTGAGISVESGIPDFRSPGGIWEKFPPEVYGTIDAFRADPERWWRFGLELDAICAGARPNPAHVALAELEKMGLLACTITQNIDGLHQAAGTKEVIELHGSGTRLVCLECGARSARPARLTAAPRCACGAVFKPDVVLFNEMLPFPAIAKAEELARTCDLCLVIGTSAEVYPAAGIPMTAFGHGATLVELNLAPTSLTHTGKVRWFVEGKVGTTLPRILELLR